MDIIELVAEVVGFLDLNTLCTAVPVVCKRWRRAVQIHGYFIAHRLSLTLVPTEPKKASALAQLLAATHEERGAIRWLTWFSFIHFDGLEKIHPRFRFTTYPGIEEFYWEDCDERGRPDVPYVPLMYALQRAAGLQWFSAKQDTCHSLYQMALLGDIQMIHELLLLKCPASGWTFRIGLAPYVPCSLLEVAVWKGNVDLYDFIAVLNGAPRGRSASIEYASYFAFFSPEPRFLRELMAGPLPLCSRDAHERLVEQVIDAMKRAYSLSFAHRHYALLRQSRRALGAIAAYHDPLAVLEWATKHVRPFCCPTSQWEPAEDALLHFIQEYVPADIDDVT